MDANHSSSRKRDVIMGKGPNRATTQEVGTFLLWKQSSKTTNVWYIRGQIIQLFVPFFFHFLLLFQIEMFFWASPDWKVCDEKLEMQQKDNSNAENVEEQDYSGLRKGTLRRCYNKNYGLNAQQILQNIIYLDNLT